MKRILSVLSVLIVCTAVLGACDQKQRKPDKEDENMADKSSKEKKSEDSITDKMADEHEGETPDATAAANIEPRQPVTTEKVDYAKLDGTTVTGYLAKPEEAQGETPGLIVIQEWWGLNDNIRKMTERLAGEGYTALAVDLYEGEVAETAKNARSLMQEAMGNKERLKENLRQGYRYLTEEAGVSRVGVIGWCFGGGWSLRTALMMPKKIDATVIYYGQLVTEKSKLKPLEMPIIGFFGSEDNAIPPKKVQAFEQVLGELDKDASIHIYEGAGHAFANPSGERYDPDAAKDAWSKTVDFLERHLQK